MENLGRLLLILMSHICFTHMLSLSLSLALHVSKASHVNQVLMMFDIDDDEGIYSVDSFNE